MGLYERPKYLLIGYANTSDLACLLGLYKSLPDILAGLCTGNWIVDEEQVYII